VCSFYFFDAGLFALKQSDTRGTICFKGIALSYREVNRINLYAYRISGPEISYYSVEKYLRALNYQQI